MIKILRGQSCTTEDKFRICFSNGAQEEINMVCCFTCRNYKENSENVRMGECIGEARTEVTHVKFNNKCDINDFKAVKMYA